MVWYDSWDTSIFFDFSTHYHFTRRRQLLFGCSIIFHNYCYRDVISDFISMDFKVWICFSVISFDWQNVGLKVIWGTSGLLKSSVKLRDLNWGPLSDIIECSSSWDLKTVSKAFGITLGSYLEIVINSTNFEWEPKNFDYLLVKIHTNFLPWKFNYRMWL